MDRFFYGSAVVFVLVAVIAAAIVIDGTTASTNLELVKARFAQVTFVGILVVFIFAGLLYAARPEVGKAIFDKAMTSMAPLAGVIIGYFFGKM